MLIYRDLSGKKCNKRIPLQEIKSVLIASKENVHESSVLFVGTTLDLKNDL
jgi:hypothetical protein